jgi:hypothetical protein
MVKEWSWSDRCFENRRDFAAYDNNNNNNK